MKRFKVEHNDLDKPITYITLFNPPYENENVLEHIKNDILEINNALEKLNFGGYLIILVPAHNKLYSKLAKAVGHYRRYDKNSMQKN